MAQHSVMQSVDDQLLLLSVVSSLTQTMQCM